MNSFKNIGEDGHIDYFDKSNILSRQQSLRKQLEIDNSISTLIPGLDEVLRGGVKRKKLCIVSGVYGIGKTTVLTFLGKSALIQGNDVLFITMEETKEEIANRFDASLTGISVNKLPNFPRKFFNRIIKISNELGNSLRIVEVPSKTMTIRDVSFLIDTLKIQYEFNTDMIIIDNLDGIKPEINRKGDILAESTDVWVAARSKIAQEKNLVLWTPSHINRSEMNEISRGDKEVAEGSGISVNIQKMNISDLHISLNYVIDSEGKIKDAGEDIQAISIYVDKNRMGRRNMIFDVDLDLATNLVKWRGTSEVNFRNLTVGRRKKKSFDKKEN